MINFLALVIFFHPKLNVPKQRFAALPSASAWTLGAAGWAPVLMLWRFGCRGGVGAMLYGWKLSGARCDRVCQFEVEWLRFKNPTCLTKPQSSSSPHEPQPKPHVPQSTALPVPRPLIPSLPSPKSPVLKLPKSGVRGLLALFLHLFIVSFFRGYSYSYCFGHNIVSSLNAVY